MRISEKDQEKRRRLHVIESEFLEMFLKLEQRHALTYSEMFYLLSKRMSYLSNELYWSNDDK